MRIPSRSGRALGLAALLAPALIVGCGAAKGAVQATPSPSPSSTPPQPPTPSPTAPTSPAEPVAPSTPSRPGTPGVPSTPSTPSTPAEPSRPTAPSPAPSPTRTPQPPPPLPGTPTSIVYGTASGGRSVALTFDDGPGPATGQILDLLSRYGVRATFCEIGPQAAADPALVRRIVAGGHRLCDHTVHHPQPMHTLSHDQQVYEITAAKDMIVKAGGAGTKVAWFRAPGGDFTAENRLIAAQDGLRPLGWSVDPRDWARPGAAAIVTAVQQQLRPGGVVLLHDGGGDRSQTVAALRQLLPWLVAQGYSFDFPAR